MITYLTGCTGVCVELSVCKERNTYELRRRTLEDIRFLEALKETRLNHKMDFLGLTGASLDDPLPRRISILCGNPENPVRLTATSNGDEVLNRYLYRVLNFTGEGIVYVGQTGSVFHIAANICPHCTQPMINLLECDSERCYYCLGLPQTSEAIAFNNRIIDIDTYRFKKRNRIHSRTGWKPKGPQS